MNTILILLTSLFVFMLWRLVNTSVQGIMGYRWWYRRWYLYSPNWRFSRWLKFKLNGRRCYRCNAVYNLDVHHKTYKHMWWEWLFLWDLEILCRQHHAEIHGR